MTCVFPLSIDARIHPSTHRPPKHPPTVHPNTHSFPFHQSAWPVCDPQWARRGHEAADPVLCGLSHLRVDGVLPPPLTHPHTHPPTHLSIHPPTHPSIHPLTSHLPTDHQSTRPHTSPPTYPPIHPPQPYHRSWWPACCPP